MSEWQVADHDVIVIDVEDTELGACCHRDEVLVGQLGSLGLTRSTASIAEQCSGLRLRFLESDIVEVFSSCLNDGVNVVKCKAGSFGILLRICFKIIETDQVLNRLSTSLGFQHNEGAKTLERAGDSCQSGLIYHKFDRGWPKSVIERDSRTRLS